MHYFGSIFQPRPARCHNKLGIVELEHSIIRALVQRLIKDAEYFAHSRGVNVENTEVRSRATFFSNVLYGSKTLSSFEIDMGYLPSLACLQKVSGELVVAHQEQVARRALHKLRTGTVHNRCFLNRLRRTMTSTTSNVAQCFGTWEVGIVRQALDHFVVLSSN